MSIVKAGVDGVEAVGVLAQPGVRVQVLLDDDGDHRRQQPGMRPGATWRWKSASSAVSVTAGSITTIERCSSLAIAFNVVRACGMLWLIHGFLPTKKATSLVELPTYGVAEHGAVHPDLAALLLSHGAAAVHAAEALVQRSAVRPTRWLPCPPPP